MLDFSASRVLTACLHRIPHPGGDAALMLSEQLLDNSAIAGLEAHLAKLFKPFNVIDRQAFTELEENKVYNDISRIFKDVQALVPSSSEIAEYLYKLSDDPAIPSGDFLVVYFQDVQLDDEMLDAIGLYKWEKKHAYGSIKAMPGMVSMEIGEGIALDKIDKGCMIFNTLADEGYTVCVTEKAAAGVAGSYWKHGFLRVAPCNDNFHQTRTYLELAKQFIQQHLPEERGLNKADEISYMQRTADYFKGEDTFVRNDFAKQVFQEDDVIDSFQNFGNNFNSNSNIDLEDHFEISDQAFKKQAKFFKSILKLDKNFHIYIHGNREMIEKGVDEQGRKFYKIFYQQEA
jgi:hypothetical protein